MDIHDVFRPFYWCGKVLGFFCFTFAPRPTCKKHVRDDITIITDVGSKASIASQQSGRLQARTSLRNCIMCLVNVAILMWSMLSVRTNSDISVILPLLGHVMDLVLWIGHMSTLITYALLFAVRQRMAGIISDLCHVDSQLESLGISINHSLHRRFVIGCCACVATMQLLIGVITSQVLFTLVNTTSYELITNFCVYLYATMTYAIMMGSYTLAMCVLQQRLWLINKHLGAMAEIRTVEGNGRCCNASMATVVQRLSYIYDRISGICSTCNAVFAMPLMSAILTSFGYNVITVYAGYKMRCDVKLHGWHMVVNVGWNVYFLLFVAALVTAGSGLALAGRNTGAVVHGLLNRLSADGEETAVSRQLGRFSLQVLHKHPVANCGLFPIDWTLLYSIIATTGTYLVIMMQFDSSLEAGRMNTTIIES